MESWESGERRGSPFPIAGLGRDLGIRRIITDQKKMTTYLASKEKIPEQIFRR